MERKDVAANVVRVIKNFIGDETDEIGEQTKLTEDLGFDSLDFAELMMELEEEFKKDIKDESAVQKCKSVGDIVDLILTLP